MSLSVAMLEATLERLRKPPPPQPTLCHADCFDMMVLRGYVSERGEYLNKPDGAPAEWYLQAYCDFNRWELYRQFTDAERAELNAYRNKRNVERWLANY